jgi:hypothetical protein
MCSNSKFVYIRSLFKIKMCSSSKFVPILNLFNFVIGSSMGIHYSDRLWLIEYIGGQEGRDRVNGMLGHLCDCHMPHASRMRCRAEHDVGADAGTYIPRPKDH